MWLKVEMVARDIVELCSRYGSLKGRGAGTMDSGIYLRVRWYPFHAIVRGADTAYIKGGAVAHIDGSPYKVSPPRCVMEALTRHVLEMEAGMRKSRQCDEEFERG